MKIKKFLFGGPGGFTTDKKEIKNRNKAFVPFRKKLALAGLTALGWIGDVFSGVLSNVAVPSGSATGATVYANSPMYRYNLTHVQPEAKKVIEKASPYVSPANHITAWTQGSFNPIVGALKLEQLGPEAQLAGAIFDIATLSKGKPAIRGAIRTVDKGLAKAGNAGAKGRVVAREINKNVDKGVQGLQLIFPGLVGWAPKQVFKGYHASNEPVFKPNFFHRGWAQETHNAPLGIYFANGKAPGHGFLTKRPYVHQVEVAYDKPMVQLGEVKGTSKNSIRNQIEEQAQSMGADGIIYNGIADNLMSNQFITKTLNPDVSIKQTKFSIGEDPLRKIVNRINGHDFIEPNVPLDPKTNYHLVALNSPAFGYSKGRFVSSPYYYYRTGWGINEDAVNTGRIRVPEGDYKTTALKKYPWLDNGNSFSTSLMNHEFPYFSEGDLWNSKGKLGKQPEDLIAIPRDGVEWVAGSKFGSLLRDKKPYEVGGRATPLINGLTNRFPTSLAQLFKYDETTSMYEPDILVPNEAVAEVAEAYNKDKGIVANPMYSNGQQRFIWRRNRWSKEGSGLIEAKFRPDEYTDNHHITINPAEEAEIPNKTYFMGINRLPFNGKAGTGLGDNISTVFTPNLLYNAWRQLHWMEPKVQELGQQYLSTGNLRPILDYYRNATPIEKQQLSSIARQPMFLNSDIPYRFYNDNNVVMKENPIIQKEINEMSPYERNLFNNSLGWASTTDNGLPIIFNKLSGFAGDRTVGHEGNHAYLYRFPQPLNMQEVLERALPAELTKLVKGKELRLSGNDKRGIGSAHLNMERGATVLDTRALIIREYYRLHGRMPSLAELNTIIDNMAEADLTKTVRSTSAYGREYAPLINDFGALREVLKFGYKKGGKI